jgi:hypothetical protein
MEHAERRWVGVRGLVSETVATSRELFFGPEVPPTVYLKASLALHKATEGMKAETIGLTTDNWADIESRGLFHEASRDYMTVIMF